MSKYMTLEQRYKLEALYNNAHMKAPAIAKELGFCAQTIYNELKLGEYVHTCDYYDKVRYSAQKAQQRHNYAQSAKGRPLKLGNEHDYARYIERKIIKEKYSPAAAIAKAKAEGYSFTVSTSTLYSYIDKRIFLKLSNKHLLIKGQRKPQASKPERRTVHPKLPSISDRPEHINQRQELGHWELDLIVGCSGSKAALMTLIERMSRRELIFKLPNKKAESVRTVFDQLEKEMPNFKQEFKSITTDNGPEFLEYDKLIESIEGGKRFDVYYCHSYSAWEKGTNENHNRMVRRFFPKGTDFTKVSKNKIAAVQEWMNDYPRKLLNWACPNDVYYNLSPRPGAAA